MANSTIKTRILLRNDALSNWLTSDVVLAKGEVAIATLADGKLAEIRIGTGSSTWADALKLDISQDQLTWLSGYYTADEVDAISAALSGDYVQKIADAIDSLSIGNYLEKSDFADLSNTIGLSAANADNQVVTRQDIANLAGAMHFKGAVNSIEEVVSAEAGDIVIIPSTSKEYVYNGIGEYLSTNWVELGDEDLYAKKADVYTKTEVDAISSALSGDYVEKIGTAKTEAYNEALSDANAYTDEQIASLSIGDYATKTEVAEISDILSGAISAITDDYLTSTDKTELEGAISDALSDANAYTDEQIAALSIGDYASKSEVSEVSVALSTDYIEKIGTAKSEAYAKALSDANAYTDEVSAALSGDYVQKIADAIDALSVDDFIKHGEVTQSDLSGFFVFDCGDSTLRDGESETSSLTAE